MMVCYFKIKDVTGYVAKVSHSCEEFSELLNSRPEKGYNK